ncbi:MAG TPA: hypothetical protein VKA74_16590, partial [Myxococcota bacterium]|nr:hypothetical protein [Myxococcota bacterium]
MTAKSSGAEGWRRWGRRGALAALVLFGVYLLIGFLVLPRVVESQLVGAAREQLGLKASVGRVGFDPLRLRLTFEELALSEPE